MLLRLLAWGRDFGHTIERLLVENSLVETIIANPLVNQIAVVVARHEKALVGVLDSSLLGASVLGTASVAGGACVVELLATFGLRGRPTKRSATFAAIMCLVV